MSDAEMRSLLHTLEECGNGEEKARLILGRIASLHDYLDILDMGVLYGNEYAQLFRGLANTELAILSAIVYREALREEQATLAEAIRDGGDPEAEWGRHLGAYLTALPPERFALVEQARNALDYEELSLA